MKKRLPSLNWLRSFEAYARHLNFTQAANELHLTQAAISRQVKSLEAQLGVDLFKRLPRDLELTDAGMAYMPVIHECIERLSAATDEIFGDTCLQPLRVRVSLVFFTHWLASRLHRFREKHPDITLRFISSIWAGDTNREDDLEIRYGSGNWVGYKTDRLVCDELFPVCSPTLINQEQLPLSPPDELSRYALLHVMGYEEGWGYWLKQCGFKHIDIPKGIQFDTLISALEMSVLGQGIALGRSSLVQSLIDEGKLIMPFEEKVKTEEAFYLATPERYSYHPHGEIFRCWLIQEAEAMKNT